MCSSSVDESRSMPESYPRLQSAEPGYAVASESKPCGVPDKVSKVQASTPVRPVDLETLRCDLAACVEQCLGSRTCVLNVECLDPRLQSPRWGQALDVEKQHRMTSETQRLAQATAQLSEIATSVDSAFGFSLIDMLPRHDSAEAQAKRGAAPNRVESVARDLYELVLHLLVNQEQDNGSHEQQIIILFRAYCRRCDTHAEATWRCAPSESPQTLLAAREKLETQALTLLQDLKLLQERNSVLATLQLLLAQQRRRARTIGSTWRRLGWYLVSIALFRDWEPPHATSQAMANAGSDVRDGNVDARTRASLLRRGFCGRHADTGVSGRLVLVTPSPQTGKKPPAPGRKRPTVVVWRPNTWSGWAGHWRRLWIPSAHSMRPTSIVLDHATVVQMETRSSLAAAPKDGGVAEGQGHGHESVLSIQRQRCVGADDEARDALSSTMQELRVLFDSEASAKAVCRALVLESMK